MNAKQAMRRLQKLQSLGQRVVLEGTPASVVMIGGALGMASRSATFDPQEQKGIRIIRDSVFEAIESLDPALAAFYFAIELDADKRMEGR